MTAAPSPSPAPAVPHSASRELKVVLVVRQDLPTSQAVNAATVLGASVGTALRLPLGPDAVDATGTRYSGIVTTPVPILATDSAELTRLYRLASEREQVTVLCLTETARRARTYEAYLGDLAATPESDTDIVGLVVAGPRNQVTKLTKKLPLLS
ncbi:DUF2000 domain-containing protein [Amycolatopsis pigmentata]|uniref:DUF2000 domain-containing protein n=1 Tax=Amycolatopsis pigmentata TaxID=450801 RepID=A0ABW5FT88_9PSEU